MEIVSEHSKVTLLLSCRLFILNSQWSYPVDNFWTVVGENPTPSGILALWAFNGLSIVYWVVMEFDPA